MRASSNPAMHRLQKYSAQQQFGASRCATYAGMGLKVLYFVVITLVAAVLFAMFLPSLLLNNSGLAAGLLIACVVVGLASGFAAAIAPRTTVVTGSLYCIAEGMLIGVVSSLFEAMVQGIIIMALLATVLTLGVIALLYFTGIVRVGSTFRRVAMASLMALVVSELAFWLLTLFVPSVSYVFYGNFVLQLAIDVVFIIVAAVTMFVDFDNMTMIVENGLDKSYEWMAAYSLMLTLIWLYMEFLRLIALIFANNN